MRIQMVHAHEVGTSVDDPVYMYMHNSCNRGTAVLQHDNMIAQEELRAVSHPQCNKTERRGRWSAIYNIEYFT